MNLNIIDINVFTFSVPKANNFPPFPSFFPCNPWFYHDISAEIPIQSQRTCKMLFYVWQCKRILNYINVHKICYICVKRVWRIECLSMLENSIITLLLLNFSNQFCCILGIFITPGCFFEIFVSRWALMTNHKNVLITMLALQKNEIPLLSSHYVS